MPGPPTLEEIDQLLSGFDATPGPAAPPAPPGQLDAINRALAEFDSPRAAADFTTAKRATESAADADNALLSVGEPAPPAPVAFDPPSSGTRDYLYNFSNGRVRLPTRPGTDAKEERNVAQVVLSLSPYRAAFVHQSPEHLQKFTALARSLVALNTDPPSPEERLTAFDRLYQSWTPRAPATGTMEGPSVPRDPPPKPDPDTARAAYAKAWATQEGDPLFRHVPENLTPAESSAFQALRSGGFFDDASAGLADTVGRLRGERILGHPIEGTGPLRFDHLAEVSPLAQSLVAAGQAGAEADAQGLLADRFISGGSDALAAARRPRTWLDAGLRAAEGGFKILDAFLLGVPSAVAQELDATTTGAKLQIAAHRAFAFGPEKDADFDRITDVLASFPNLSDDDKIQLASQTLNAPRGVQLAATGLGLSEPFGQFLADYAGAQLSLGGLVLNGLGAYGWAKKIKSGNSPLHIGGPKTAPLSAELAASLQRPNYTSLALHADNVQDVVLRLAEVDDPITARGITERLETQLKTSEQPLTNERTAAALATIDKANRTLAQVKPTEYLNDAGKSALADLSAPLAELSPYDQALVLTGSAKRAGSEALAAQAVNWLEAQHNTKTRLEIPTNIKDGLTIQEGALARAARLEEVSKRRDRLLDLTGDLDRQLGAELQLHTRQQEKLLASRRDTTRAYNDVLADAHQLAARIETEGASVARPNPLLKSPAYPLVRAAVGKPGGRIGTFLRGSPPDNITYQARALRKAAGDPTVREALGDLSVPDEALVDQARTWLRRAEAPLNVTVPPSPTPRTSLIDSVRAKLQAQQPGQIVRLTKTELDFLNEHLPGKIIQPTKAVAGVWDTLLENVTREATTTSELRTHLAALRKQIEDAPPDTLKLSVKKTLADALARKLDLRPDDKGYLSLFPAADKVELRGADAFREALEFHKSELTALRTGLVPTTAFELNSLPLRSRATVSRDAVYSASQAENFLRFKSKQFAKILERDVSPAEAQEILRDFRAGKPRTEAAAVLYQKHLRSSLDRLLRLGEISPAFYHSLIRSDYYHGTFDRSTRAALDAEARRTGPLVRLNSRFQPLRTDPAAFKFKIPETEGEYYAAWREGTTVAHKTGFKSPDEASAFLDTLPDTVKEAAVHKNWTFNEKLASGLVGEIGTSTLHLNEILGRQIAAAQSAVALEALELIQTPRRLGIPDNYEGAEFTAGAEKWVRIPDSGPVRARGKWINEKAAAMLREQSFAGDFITANTKAIATATDEAYKNPYLAPSTRALTALATAGGKVTGGLLGLLSASKIALSLKAWGAARMGNVFYSSLAGVPLSPRAALAKLRHERDYHRLNSAAASDPALDALQKKGFIPPPHATSIDADAARLTERNWKSVEALEARVQHLESEILKTSDPAVLEKLQVHRLELAEQLRQKTNEAHATNTRELLTAARAGLADVFQGARGIPGSKSGTALWKLYDNTGGDSATKYHITRWYMEEHGYTPDAAADVAGTFTQQLHRTPEAVKSLTNRFGGAHFVSFPLQQLRILWEAVKRDPARLARWAAGVWHANSLTLAAMGIDEDEFLEQSAFQNGVQRTPINDLMTKLRGAYIPLGNGEVGTFSFIPFFGSPFTSDSRAARKAVRLLTQDSDNPVTDLGARLAVGAASKFFGADVGFQTVSAFLEGTDEKGDPITGPGDLFAMVGRTATPDWFLGNKDWDRFGRAFAGAETDPRTHRTKTPARLAAERFMQFEQFQSPWHQLSAAVLAVQKSSNNLPAYKANEHFDDMLTTRAVREAKNADGTFDPARLAEVVRSYYAENPATIPAADREISKTPTPDDLKRAGERSVLPTTLRRFHRLAIDDQLGAYALYRRNNSAPSPDVEEPLSRLLDQKLRARGKKESLLRAAEVAQSYLDNPGTLPADALQKLKLWGARARAAAYGASIE